MPETILIVDDDPQQLRMAEYAVGQKLKYHVAAADGEEAIRWVLSGRSPQPDLLLLGLAMADTGGLDVIRLVKAHRPQLPIVLLLPYGDEQRAAQALQAGASDYLTKPASLERLSLTLQNALRLQRMSTMIARLERKAAGHVSFADVIGQCPRMKDALMQAEAAAASRIPVWIEGEPGTGKEWLARAIHGSGERAGKPFVTVDCRSLSEDAGGALLFGQEKRPGNPYAVLGKLREADQGTLLLRHIGDLSLPLQHRLLEALESKTVRTPGGQATVPVDLRLITASTEKAEILVAQDRLSPMLCSRLKGTVIALPPLRDRRQDIAPLARHFVESYAAAENKYVRGLTEQALQHLSAAPWPGNVQQLSHLLWRTVILCNQEMLDSGDIRLIQQLQPVHYEAGGDPITMNPLLLDMQGRMKKLKSIEEEAIRFALSYSGGCMTRAARSLGIGRSTLYRRVNELAMEGHISRANQTTRPMMKVSSADRS